MGMGGDLAPNLGGPKKISRHNFRKNSDDLFLVIDLVLRIFSFFSHIFRMFTMINVVYDHFLTRKTQFFTLFMHAFTHIRQHYFSKYWGGPMHGRPPPLKFWGAPPPPSSPRSPPLIATRIQATCSLTLNRS